MKLRASFRKSRSLKNPSSLDNYRFTRPSFLEGLTRMFDFSSSLDNYDYLRGGPEADARAITQDWEVIGADFRAALPQTKEEVK
jgi:hypothetical protein